MPAGGVEAAVASLARSLSEIDGVSPIVIDPFSGYSTLAPSAVEIVRLPQLRAVAGAFTRVPRGLDEAIGSADADVLHVHLGAQYTLAHPRSVLTVHGFPHLESSLRHPGARGRLSAAVLEGPFRRGVKGARQVIAISDEVADLAEGLGVEYTRIANPLRKALFSVERAPGSDFLTVGDLMRRKNQRFLIDAFLEYARRGGPGRLLVAGSDSDPRYAAECRDAAAALPGRIEFLGRVDEATLLTMLARARAWVTTSLRETSSIALAEALASNCPVLSFDVGTARAQVDDRAGIVLPVGSSVQDVATALARIGDGTRSTARSAVAAQHPDLVAKATLAVYRTVLRGH
ncbi:glycosyltransferase family 4 protein [Nocardioides massiliensis]|uniref:glycosyltransferase family 4 protein n=1 Tax=Nocardioides massiliensis TaxID=1325935 RepID=UPI000B16BCB6|nr:glycosyltransferase family 4 protein [Nocardioides massiliensis]